MPRSYPVRHQDWNRDGIVDHLDAQIAQWYRGYDMDSDGRVATAEWPGDQRLFTRLDVNRDRYLTVQEYTTGAGFNLDSQGGPANTFSNVDSNRDGWVTRAESRMNTAEFNRFDTNSDNRISRFEFENVSSYSDNDPSSYYDRFASVDVIDVPETRSYFLSAFGTIHIPTPFSMNRGHL